MEAENEMALSSRLTLVGQLHHAIFPSYDNEKFMAVIHMGGTTDEVRNLIDARYGDQFETALHRLVKHNS